MNIFVIATTLQAGGGITIYKQFLSHLPEFIGENKYWIFINPILPTTDIKGVTYVTFSLQSKIKRILFEGRWLKDYAKKNGISPDVVVSLQNNGYKCFKGCKQFVYYHQSLPLYPGLYNPIDRTERTLFKYKCIFPYFVKRTWVKKTKYIVQTPVVRTRFSSYFGIMRHNIYVCFPDIYRIDLSEVTQIHWNDGYYHFLFVGDDLKYRNGRTIIEAIYILSRNYPKLAKLIRVHITSTAEMSPKLYRYISYKNLSSNFIFEGILKHDNLLSLYKSVNALLFPSSIETVGLPVLEAASFGTPIIAGDVDYAHCVLKGYQGVVFSNYLDYDKWAIEIKNLCEPKKRVAPLLYNDFPSWDRFFPLLDDFNIWQ